jgi:hypothetical protein
MNLPPNLNGSNAEARIINIIFDTLRSLEVFVGPGLRASKAPNGQRIELDPIKVGASTTGMVFRGEYSADLIYHRYDVVKISADTLHSGVYIATANPTQESRPWFGVYWAQLGRLGDVWL